MVSSPLRIPLSLYGEMTRDKSISSCAAPWEPWLVLGEEGTAGGKRRRYVDSSLERVQVKVKNFTPERYVLTCNRRQVPLHATDTQGVYVAGVRYRAWQPPNCLHSDNWDSYAISV